MSFDRVAVAGEHIVVGGGHFVERGGQMVQEFANHVQVGSRSMSKLDEIKGAIDNCFGWTEKYTHQNCQPFPEYTNPIIVGADNLESSFVRSKIDLNFGKTYWGPKAEPGFNYTMKCSNDLDSSAWNDRWSDFKDSHLAGSIKEFGLALGSGMAGDGQGAVEHGAAAAQEWWMSRQEIADRTDAMRGTWQNDAR